MSNYGGAGITTVDRLLKARLSAGVSSQLSSLGVPLTIVALVVVFGAVDGRFATGSNAENIMRQGAVLAVVSLGQAFVILAGGIDISVGSAVGLASVVTALIAGQFGLWAGLAAGLGVGLLVGAVNGYFVAVWRLNSMIVTLGTLSIARAMAFIISDGNPISDVPDDFSVIGLGSAGNVPFMALIATAAAITCWIVLNRTSVGRFIYVVGGNEVAANLSGVNVVKYRFFAFVASGLLVGVAAILASSRINSGNPLIGTGYELRSIGAVVIGGVSLRGGEGSVWGGVLGALLMTILANGLTLIGFSSYLQLIITGVILVVAVWIDLSLHRQAG